MAMTRDELNKAAFEAKKKAVARQHGKKIQVIMPENTDGILAIPGAYRQGTRPVQMELKRRELGQLEDGTVYLKSQEDIKPTAGFDTVSQRFGKKSSINAATLNISSEQRARIEEKATKAAVKSFLSGLV